MIKYGGVIVDLRKTTLVKNITQLKKKRHLNERKKTFENCKLSHYMISLVFSLLDDYDNIAIKC